MGFDLDWEQLTFRGLVSLWRRMMPAPAPSYSQERAALLDDHRARLQLIAQILANEPVRVLPAREHGGVRGLDILLPPHVDIAPTREENAALYLVRTVVAAGIIRSGRHRQPAQEELPRAAETLAAAREAEAELVEELPALRTALADAKRAVLAARPALVDLSPQQRLLERARLCALDERSPLADAELLSHLQSAPSAGGKSPPLWLYGELIPATLEAPDVRDAGAEKQGAAPIDGTEVDAPAIEEIRRVVLDKKEQERSALMHTFEKVETADDYQGGARDTDSSDELDDHLEALAEVDLRDVIRGGDPAQSLLKADVMLDADVPDVGEVRPGERGILYDEWDKKRGAYRLGWCTVYPTALGPGDPTWATAALASARPLINELERRLIRLRAERRAKNRQLDGADVDINAVVDEIAAARAGAGGDPRLYTRQERQRRDFATTLLLDISLSSDAWVAGRRVLDVVREAALVLGEVADRLGDRVQILAFGSHTRNHCRVYEVRGFSEPWPIGRARLGILRPQGYTRIGPALRHATAQLAATRADRRLLLLISDGKPTDFDRYEGRYGVADIRQALREAAALRIDTHALAIDEAARDYLPEMLGPGAWHVLSDPSELPALMTNVWGRVVS